MTLQAAPPAPASRPFAVSVAARRRLSPHFLRVTLTGPDLDELASGGADQRVKLLFPLPGQQRPVLPAGDDWYARWRAQPPAQRSPMRTYTLRAARPGEREVDVDLVLHGATGPASAWAERCAVGDEVLVVGPNARFEGRPGGVEWRPPAPPRPLVLAGDETAVPAVCAIAEALAEGEVARVLLEVPTPADALPLQVPAGVQVMWLPRRDGSVEHPHGALLHAAVLAAVGAAPGEVRPADLSPDELVWEVPEGGEADAGPYVWLAGEAGAVTALRRALVQDAGLDRRSVAFMGYWRRGRSES